MKTIEIDMKHLKVDEDFNARHVVSDDSGEHAKAAQTVEGLAKAIKRDGQLTPILVTEKAGKYELVAGFRRVAAIKSNKGKSVFAMVVDPKSRMDVYLLNLKENMARKDLTSYEVASRCAMLIKKNDSLRKGGKAKKGTAGTLASELGISHGYLNKLLRAHNCHPTILKAWSQGDGRCIVRNLEKWSAVKPAEQLRLFGEAGGEGGGGDNAGGGESPKTGARPGEQKAKRANNELIKLAITAASGATADTRYKQGVIAALRWVVGEDDAIKDIFDPASIVEAKNAEKDAKKAVKKQAANAKKKEKLEAELAKLGA